LELAAPLAQHVAALETMLSEQARFDPATARRRFRIAAINYV